MKKKQSYERMLKLIIVCMHISEQACVHTRQIWIIMFQQALGDSLFFVKL